MNRPMRNLDSRGISAVLTYSVLFLFFLQLLGDFIAALYANGVMVGKLPAEMPVVALFLSPLLLILVGRGLSATALVVVGELVLVSRVLEVMLPSTGGKLLAAAAGTGLFLLLLPAILWDRGRRGVLGTGAVMAAGLMLAVAMSIMLRTLGSTIDWSSEGWGRTLTWLLAIVAAVLLPRVLGSEPQEMEPVPGNGEWADDATGADWGRSILLAIGLMSIYTLLYFAFASPTVISRWTGFNYLTILVVVVVALILFAWALGRGKLLLKGISRRSAIGLTALFALSLTLTLWAHQVSLPGAANSYPIADPQVSPIWTITLLVMLVLFPILFLDFALLVEAVVLDRPTLRQLGLGFGIASMLMLLLILANVFTSVWAYIDLVLEPLFRYRFWLVTAFPALLLTLSMLAVSQRAVEASAEAADQEIGRGLALIVTAVGAIALAAAFLLSPSAEVPPEPTGRLTVAGYNIQQGYDEDGQRGHRAQCDLLKAVNADIIGLSENDTARIAGGNFDAPRYLAECLDMNAYIAPKSGAGTFGYGLLSKYPIDDPQAFHLYSGPGFVNVRDPERESAGDQVAVLQGQISAGGERFHIFVNHFDSYPPREQPEGFGKLAAGLDRVIAVGDYNCEPDTECFRIMSEVLVPCAASSADPEAGRGQVDHIFVSADLACPVYRYVSSPASDHPLVVAEIEW